MRRTSALLLVSAKPLLTGLTNPVPVAVTPDGAVLVGDWGTGSVYRVAAV